MLRTEEVLFRASIELADHIQSSRDSMKGKEYVSKEFRGTVMDVTSKQFTVKHDSSNTTKTLPLTQHRLRQLHAAATTRK